MADITINKEQRLYVLPHAGGGYSCLGFEYADKRARAVLAWLTGAGEGKAVTLTAELGTIEHYAQYQAIMDAGARYNRKSGRVCEAELIPAFRGLRNQRVEVRMPDGTKSRFYVGKSTGWMPCHLEIKRRDSTGGGAVYFPEGATVRVVGGSRYR